MTAEIAVLNKFGAALAADSAITVDVFHQNKIKTKVHNTANKLFTLSKHAPVGVMYYNTVTLGGVPWETIVKSYRGKLGRDRKAKLRDYADDFFAFLAGNASLFPDSQIKHIFFVNVARLLLDVAPDKGSKADFVARLDEKIAELEKVDPVDSLTEAEVRAALKAYKLETDTAIEAFLKPTFRQDVKKKLAHLMGLYLGRKSRMSGYSGLVFCGFGEDEFMPRLEQYTVDLYVLGKVRRWREKEFCVTQTEQSEVIPFADTEVIKTLTEGISPSFENEAYLGVLRLLKDFPRRIFDPVTELTDAQKAIYISAARAELPDLLRDYFAQMDKHRKENYIDPIKAAISSLPIGELGAVAEAFLNSSQILKRVNPDIETVGGPIDVAVISKGDGFVWIKRKHYFEAALNQSFSTRYLDD